MKKEKIELLVKVNELYMLNGKHIIYCNTNEVAPQTILDSRDRLCKEALSKNYQFIVYYQNKKDSLDCGLYVAPFVTYKHLLNAFLRPDDEYFVYDTTTETWIKGKYQKKDFIMYGGITLDNYRTIWFD